MLTGDIFQVRSTYFPAKRRDCTFQESLLSFQIVFHTFDAIYRFSDTFGPLNLRL
ncbi:hypothetical protein SAMN05216563_101330 [Phytobacter palmae]|nr:hypothetical protein SAMN05216563_101330 [Phytobacter palmae]